MNTAKKTIDLAYKTWLAGVGAYDSGREISANKFDQLFVDGSAFVTDLLERGESVETQVLAKLEDQKMLKNKISALRAKLGFGNANRGQQIDMLSQRVDSLIEVVAKLAQQKAAEKQSTTIARPAKEASVNTLKKTVSKATTVKTPAKAAASKPVAKPATKPVTKATAPKARAKTASKPAAKPATKPVAKVTATKTQVKAAAKPATKTVESKASAKPEVAKTANKPEADEKD